MASRAGDRVVALSRQLAQAHQELRRRIDEIRKGLGHRRLGDDVLLTHCIAFCAALTAHHQGEGDGIFPQLLAQRPDLAATISRLIEDHEMIASILGRVAELTERAAGAKGSALGAIGRELDGLTAIMESHFNYEERTISEALDAGISSDGWSEKVFRLRLG